MDMPRYMPTPIATDAPVQDSQGFERTDWPPTTARVKTSYDQPKVPFPIDPYLQKQLMNHLLEARSYGDYRRWALGGDDGPDALVESAAAIQQTPDEHKGCVTESLAALAQAEQTGAAPKDATANVASVVSQVASQGAAVLPSSIATTVTQMVPSLTSAQVAPGASAVAFKDQPPGHIDRFCALLHRLFKTDHAVNTCSP